MTKGAAVMALAQLITPASDKTKRNEYTTMVKLEHRRKRFILMDNGANEGVQLDYDALMERASYILADEMVLPDVLGNSHDTFVATMDFLQKTTRFTDHCQYQAVVQGTNQDQLKGLIGRFAQSPRITTLGLPRLLLGQPKLCTTIRIDMANWIKEEYGDRFQIHFLGASSLWVKEPYYAARYASHVRSIDTSLPYNYALAGALLTDTTRRIDRASDYFTRSHSGDHLECVNTNEEIYSAWCRAVTPSPTVKSVR
jgi:hypothetical protein